jgi:ribose 5-phosphate isomerase A
MRPMKEKVAQAIAERVKDGEILGIGTGSTVDLAISAIAKRVKEEGLRIKALTTSIESAWGCQRAGIEVLNNMYQGELDWGFDGADEVDPELRLIKGKGGAMYQEKIVAALCKYFIAIVDDSKLVKRLGEKMPVPVEFTPRAYSLVERGLRKLGAEEVVLRQATGKHGAVITESASLIFDARFKAIPPSLEHEIKSIVGVVESGIFTSFADEVLVAGAQGVVSMKRSKS